jgi:hypothetical protein
MHVVTAIIQLRQPNNNRGADGDTFSVGKNELYINT